MTVACDAAKARLTAATALLEVCQGRHYPATALRVAFLLDPFKPVPADMIEIAALLDGGK